MSTDDPLLQAQDLHKDFGGVHAVQGASFSLASGEFVGLIGPNGAGKTTVFNLLAGSLDPTSGTVVYKGEDVTELSANRRAQNGLVRTFQIPRPFRRLTVLENTMVAGPDHPGEGFLHGLLHTAKSQRTEAALEEKAREILTFVDLIDKQHTLSGHLSGGQRKLLEIARALMLDPEVMLLDEPMAGVNPTLARQIVARLKDLHEQGVTLCVVEHDMDFVQAHCPRTIVMVQGEVLVDGPPSEVLDDPRVLEAYLGGGQAPTAPGDEEETA